MKYTEIVQQNKLLKANNRNTPYSVGVLSNVTIDPFAEVMEYTLQAAGINAGLTLGDYDNIVQDAAKFQGHKAVIVFLELANVTDGLQYKLATYEHDQLQQIVQKVKDEVSLVWSQLRETPLVLFSSFCAAPFDRPLYRQLADELNQFLVAGKPDNCHVVDVQSIYSQLGISEGFDYRFFYSSKAPYSLAFFKRYAEMARPLVLAANGIARKALIFDCDNTLWHGILGEDGVKGIQMSGQTTKGIPFEAVQNMALSLARQGVIIGLCSKNNPGDVDDVLSNHPDMTLVDEFIAIKMVNWNDKVSNLKQIAQTLNIGLDSLVFVDDSDFEINLVKEQLPQVATFQVPRKRYLYPSVMAGIEPLFQNLSATREDKQRLQMYKEQARRGKEQARVSDLSTYLAALQIKMAIHVDDHSIIPRMSQMTLKTNQFNLTTRRYSEPEIAAFVESPSHRVLAIDVCDRYGQSGITGLAIVHFSQDTATVDTLLLSCRILGRNIERVFFDHLISSLAGSELAIKTVQGTYCRTKKNEQVTDLYDQLGFELEKQDDSTRYYRLSLVNYQPSNVNYIDVSHAK